MTQIRQLFLLLIRMYDPSLLANNFLQDLVTTNHRYLITQENIDNYKPPVIKTFDALEHMKQ